MNRPEIVAPAGSLEKLKFAVLYGADAVYFGGGGFNLRVQADNFTPEDIQEALEFCGQRGVKTVFLVNSFLHEHEIGTARKYLEGIRQYTFGALMVSDPGMLLLIREAGIDAPVHLSTQMSTLNHLSVKFWQDAGVKRIVLARETTLEEVRAMRGHTDAELEVFVHGALCISYSGRCLLSRYLSGRDANRGDCSHPCRWRYELMEEKRPGSPLEIVEYGSAADGGTEILSSKDLCLIARVREYAEAGVSAFKIEGRMKSLYYAANTTRIYRHAAETAAAGGFSEHLPFWRRELDLINHRPYTDDLFSEFGTGEFSGVPYVKKALFLGYIEKPGTWAGVKTFNPIRPGETVDCIYPIEGGKITDMTLRVEEIKGEDGTVQEMARPGSTNTIRFDRDVMDYGILRRRTREG